MPRQVISLGDVEVAEGVDELSAVLNITECSARKMRGIVDFRSDHRNGGNREFIIWVRKWVAEEHDHAGPRHREPDGTRDPVPDSFLVATNVIDYSDSSYKLEGAFWMDSGIILDDRYEWGDFSVTSALDIVDLTDKLDWIDDRSVCWVPKDSAKVFEIR